MIFLTAKDGYFVVTLDLITTLPYLVHTEQISNAATVYREDSMSRRRQPPPAQAVHQGGTNRSQAKHFVSHAFEVHLQRKQALQIVRNVLKARFHKFQLQKTATNVNHVRQEKQRKEPRQQYRMKNRTHVLHLIKDGK